MTVLHPGQIWSYNNNPGRRVEIISVDNGIVTVRIVGTGRLTTLMEAAFQTDGPRWAYTLLRTSVPSP